MVKLALIVGGIVGALIATLLATPREAETPEALVEETEPEDVVGKVKQQIRAAQLATRAEMQAKEAEMLAEYEASRHNRPQNP